MILFSTHNITVKLRYYFNNNGQHYFQRAVPRALCHFFMGKKIVRHKLPPVHSQMLVEIDRLSRHYDRHFRALKSGQSGTAEQIQEQAVALLAAYGLMPGDANSPARVPDGMYAFPHLDDIEGYMQVKKLAGTLTDVDRLAALILTRPMPILLSQVPSIYFQNHERGVSEKFKKGTIKRWKNIYEVTGGDIPLTDVTRDMARQYVRYRLQTVKTTTVDRELKAIRAAINKVILEKELKFTNPFIGLTIPKKGKDSIPRVIFTVDEYRTLIQSCVTKGDEIRTLILVACLTATRPSEVAGLRREDVFLDDEYPHFNLVEYNERRLKTKSSVRKVPLVPLGVNAIRQLLDSHTDKSVFPRYCDGIDVSGDSVSAVTSQYIRGLDINKTLYSARHTVKTLLDQAGITEYLTESIGGWGQGKISRGYGEGHSLEQKYHALVKALKPVIDCI